MLKIGGQANPEVGLGHDELTKARQGIRKILGIRRRLALQDIKLISIMFCRLMSGERKIDCIKLINEAFPDKSTMIESLDRILGLISIGVLDCESRKFKLSRGRYSKRQIIALDRSDLLDTLLFFSPAFVKALLSDGGKRFSRHKPYESNQEFLREAFSFIEQLQESRNVARLLNTDQGNNDNELFVMHWDYIQGRLNKTKNTDIPFTKACTEYAFSSDEQMLVLYLLYLEACDQIANVKDAARIISTDFGDIKRKERILSSDSRLFREGIILLYDTGGIREYEAYIQLSPDITSFLLSDAPQSSARKVTDIIADSRIFTLVRPENDFSSLILDDKTIGLFKDGIAQFTRDSQSTLSYWGFGDDAAKEYSFDALIYNDFKPSLLVLLYGPPGTGKTYGAYAVAKELKKDVLVTDMSRILSKWVGESEQNVSSIFATYRRISKRTDNPPLLLLNEADQFLSKRGAVGDATARMYNQMQNLFLEQFEKFKGVLVATTNLVDNIDPAFSRRFSLKIKLDMPSAPMRLKLWEKLIPPKAPLSSDVDLDHLANNYNFSGGQIATVVKNAAVAASIREVKDKRIAQADLIRYAELEHANSFDGAQNKIGFYR